MQARMPIHTSLLSFSPKVVASPGSIVATTCPLYQVILLGLFLRRVTVDSRLRVVSINDRWFWLISRSRRFAFERIQAIAYGYVGSYDYVEGESGGGGERFEVALTLRDGEEVPLFKFEGDAPVTNEAPILLEHLTSPIEEALDLAGTQQEESLGFVDLLAARIGVEIGMLRG